MIKKLKEKIRKFKTNDEEEKKKIKVTLKKEELEKNEKDESKLHNRIRKI